MGAFGETLLGLLDVGGKNRRSRGRGRHSYLSEVETVPPANFIVRRYISWGNPVPHDLLCTRLHNVQSAIGGREGEVCVNQLLGWP